MAGALDGLVVLDLTTHLSGPFCGMQLADLGADVIKIESPQGDAMRGAPPFVEGESAPFMLWNRNKRGLKLDLKDKDDLATFWELVDGADVVLFFGNTEVGYDGEGSDRTHLNLHDGQDELIERLAARNARIAVVVATPIGRLQVERHAREDRTGVRAFTDAVEARTYCSAR